MGAEPPVEENALASLRARLDSPAGPVLLYDFTSAGAAPSRLVAGMIQTGGATWFFKLNGPAPAVSAARPAFLTLLKGLRLAPR